MNKKRRFTFGCLAEEVIEEAKALIVSVLGSNVEMRLAPSELGYQDIICQAEVEDVLYDKCLFKMARRFAPYYDLRETKSAS